MVVLASLGNSGVATGSTPPEFSKCAWPIMMSPEGLGNYLGGPDGQARYWLTPFRAEYQTMEIRGRYPHARYFSIVAYNGGGNLLPISTARHLYDTVIAPDPGSANPYLQSIPPRPREGAGDSYTVYVTRDDGVPGAANVIKVTDNYAWVYLRIYVPSEVDSLSGRAFSGGVNLPTIKLYEAGKDVPEVLEPCPLKAPQPSQKHYPVRSLNKLSDVRALLRLWFPEGTDINQASDHGQAPADDRIWFAPPWNPPMLLMPNPDNKYLAAIPGPYQKDRIIVMRAKIPTVPGDGAAKADMRYWSIVLTDFELPVASVGSLYDGSVVTHDGWYTVVISDDVVRPDWLPGSVTWMPWGDPDYPKWLFYRNMIPVQSETEYDSADLFPHAIQKVVAGCWRGKRNPDPVKGKQECNHPDAVVDFTFPDLPPRADFTSPGRNTRKIMGDYYPVAVWCDRSDFDRGGWRACLEE
jgi:hypothetical protein